MEAVFLKLFNMSITAGWMILAILLVRLLFKRVPKIFCCLLWSLVGMRLVCPFSPESIFSLIPSAETVPEQMLYATKPQLDTGISVLNDTINPVISQNLSPNIGDSVNPMQVITLIGAYVWLVGMVVLLLYAGISYFRIHRKVRVSLPMEDKIYLCDDINSPFILGILRPKIYIPSTLNEEQIEYVIAHEKAHLNRRDHWWKPVGFLLLCVYWFHLLIWVGYACLCKDIELACDEKVIDDLGEAGKKSYSEALLFCSVSRRMIVGCPLAFGEVGVKERVRAVLHYKKPAFWVVMAGMLVCGVIMLCFLTNPANGKEEVFGHTYRVEKSVYVAPETLTSSIAYTMDMLPQYHFSEDYVMYRREMLSIEEMQKGFAPCGSMQEVELTAENFDNYFEEYDFCWHEELTPQELRRGNRKAWQLVSIVSMNCYLLQQKDGQLYLATWYYNSDKNGKVSYLYELTRADEVSVMVGTADTSVEQASSTSVEEPQQDAGNSVPSEDTMQETSIFANIEDATQDESNPAHSEATNQSSSAEQLPETTELTEQEKLDSAIRKAILGSDYGKNMEGLLCHTASYVILGTEQLCGTPTVDGGEGKEYLKVYVRAWKQSFVYEYPSKEPVPNLTGGNEGARIITFEISPDGEYELVEYWNPEFTGKYYTGVKDYFPDDIEELALNEDLFVAELEQDCYEQAVRYGNSSCISGTDMLP